MLPLLHRRVEALARAVAYGGVMLLVVTMIVTVADIVLRRAGIVAFAGTVDITQLLVMAAVFAAIPFAFLSEAHIVVDIATEKLPARAIAGLKAAGAVLGLLFMAAALRYGWAQAAQQYGYGDRSQTIGIPILWYWGPLLFGCALSVVATALIALRQALVAVRGP
jgi:TRAP-type C4-dicarboxylate transport system permease small subunit